MFQSSLFLGVVSADLVACPDLPDHVWSLSYILCSLGRETGLEIPCLAGLSAGRSAQNQDCDRARVSIASSPAEKSIFPPVNVVV